MVSHAMNNMQYFDIQCRSQLTSLNNAFRTRLNASSERVLEADSGTIHWERVAINILEWPLPVAVQED